MKQYRLQYEKNNKLHMFNDTVTTAFLRTSCASTRKVFVNFVIKLKEDLQKKTRYVFIGSVSHCCIVEILHRMKRLARINATRYF